MKKLIIIIRFVSTTTVFYILYWCIYSEYSLWYLCCRVSRYHIGKYMQNTEFQQSHWGDLLELQLNIQMALLFLINEKPLKVQLFKKHCCIYLFTVIDIQIFFKAPVVCRFFLPNSFQKGIWFCGSWENQGIEIFEGPFLFPGFCGELKSFIKFIPKKRFSCCLVANLEAGMPSFKAGDTLFFAAPDRAALLVTLAPILFCDLMFCAFAFWRAIEKSNNYQKHLFFEWLRSLRLTALWSEASQLPLLGTFKKNWHGTLKGMTSTKRGMSFSRGPCSQSKSVVHVHNPAQFFWLQFSCLCNSDVIAQLRYHHGLEFVSNSQEWSFGWI